MNVRRHGLRRLVLVTRRLGLVGALRYLLAERLWRLAVRVAGRDRLPDTYTLRSPGCPTSLRCRFGSTDRHVFSQVFIERVYDITLPTATPHLVIDAGANAGFSTAYLLVRYPTAHVIAVEADDRNFAVLCQNVAAFGERVTALNRAVWSHPTALVLSRGTFGDGREWATEVREAGTGETADVEAVDVAGLLALSGRDRVDLLKLDVEGAEGPILRHSGEWIDRVDVMVAELHGDECRRAFSDAVRAERFDTHQHGELTFARVARDRSR